MKTKYVSIPYVIWVALFVVAPFILIIAYALTTRDGSVTLSNFKHMGDYVPVFVRSIILALIATAICILLGYPMAYTLARFGARAQTLCVMLIMLPMWMNFLLRTYAWMSILENTGLLNRFLNLIGLPSLNMINTQGAVVLGMVYNYLPFMVLPIYSVIVKLDVSLVEAAQDLGASAASVFAKVIFPLSLPGVISGITMVFVPALSTFIIPKLLGGGTTMLLGDLIEMQFLGSAYNPHLGSAISLIMMIVVLASMWLMNRFGEGEEQAVVI